MASSVLGVDLGNLVCAVEIRVASIEEVRRGMGSSGLVKCERNGKNGLYGSGWSRSCEERSGTS